MRLLRSFAVAFALLVAFAAQAETAPADVLREMYKIAIAGAESSNGQGFSDPAFRKKFFTASLSKIVDAIEASEAATNEAILDFDPILDMNGDAGAENLVVRVLNSEAHAAAVVATFGKGNERRSVAYRFVEEVGGWRVDDITSPPGATGNQVWSIRGIYDNEVAQPKKN